MKLLLMTLFLCSGCMATGTDASALIGRTAHTTLKKVKTDLLALRSQQVTLDFTNIDVKGLNNDFGTFQAIPQCMNSLVDKASTFVSNLKNTEETITPCEGATAKLKLVEAHGSKSVTGITIDFNFEMSQKFLHTRRPTASPSTSPTTSPTLSPTTKFPTVSPTNEPTPEPTAEPTIAPTNEPTPEPTVVPTSEPTAQPTGILNQANNPQYIFINGFSYSHDYSSSGNCYKCNGWYYRGDTFNGRYKYHQNTKLKQDGNYGNDDDCRMEWAEEDWDDAVLAEAANNWVIRHQCMDCKWCTKLPNSNTVFLGTNTWMYNSAEGNSGSTELVIESQSEAQYHAAYEASLLQQSSSDLYFRPTSKDIFLNPAFGAYFDAMVSPLKMLGPKIGLPKNAQYGALKVIPSMKTSTDITSVSKFSFKFTIGYTAKGHGYVQVHKSALSVHTELNGVGAMNIDAKTSTPELSFTRTTPSREGRINVRVQSIMDPLTVPLSGMLYSQGRFFEKVLAPYFVQTGSMVLAASVDMRKHASAADSLLAEYASSASENKPFVIVSVPKGTTYSSNSCPKECYNSVYSKTTNIWGPYPVWTNGPCVLYIGNTDGYLNMFKGKISKTSEIAENQYQCDYSGNMGLTKVNSTASGVWISKLNVTVQTGIATGSPTSTPTASPTASQTASPTASPTAFPTASPTSRPTMPIDTDTQAVAILDNDLFDGILPLPFFDQKLDKMHNSFTKGFKDLGESSVGTDPFLRPLKSALTVNLSPFFGQSRTAADWSPPTSSLLCQYVYKELAKTPFATLEVLPATVETGETSIGVKFTGDNAIADHVMAPIMAKLEKLLAAVPQAMKVDLHKVKHAIQANFKYKADIKLLGVISLVVHTSEKAKITHKILYSFRGNFDINELTNVDIRNKTQGLRVAFSVSKSSEGTTEMFEAFAGKGNDAVRVSMTDKQSEPVVQKWSGSPSKAVWKQLGLAFDSLAEIRKDYFPAEFDTPIPGVGCSLNGLLKRAFGNPKTGPTWGPDWSEMFDLREWFAAWHSGLYIDTRLDPAVRQVGHLEWGPGPGTFKMNEAYKFELTPTYFLKGLRNHLEYFHKALGGCNIQPDFTSSADSIKLTLDFACPLSFAYDLDLSDVIYTIGDFGAGLHLRQVFQDHLTGSLAGKIEITVGATGTPKVCVDGFEIQLAAKHTSKIIPFKLGVVKGTFLDANSAVTMKVVSPSWCSGGSGQKPSFEAHAELSGTFTMAMLGKAIAEDGIKITLPPNNFLTTHTKLQTDIPLLRQLFALEDFKAVELVQMLKRTAYALDRHGKEFTHLEVPHTRQKIGNFSYDKVFKKQLTKGMMGDITLEHQVRRVTRHMATARHNDPQNHENNRFIQSYPTLTLEARLNLLKCKACSWSGKTPCKVARKIVAKSCGLHFAKQTTENSATKCEAFCYRGKDCDAWAYDPSGKVCETASDNQEKKSCQRKHFSAGLDVRCHVGPQIFGSAPGGSQITFSVGGKQAAVNFKPSGHCSATRCTADGLEKYLASTVIAHNPHIEGLLEFSTSEGTVVVKLKAVLADYVSVVEVKTDFMEESGHPTVLGFRVGDSIRIDQGAVFDTVAGFVDLLKGNLLDLPTHQKTYSTPNWIPKASLAKNGKLTPIGKAMAYHPEKSELFFDINFATVVPSTSIDVKVATSAKKFSLDAPAEKGLVSGGLHGHVKLGFEFGVQPSILRCSIFDDKVPSGQLRFEILARTEVNELTRGMFVYKVGDWEGLKAAVAKKFGDKLNVKQVEMKSYSDVSTVQPTTLIAKLVVIETVHSDTAFTTLQMIPQAGHKNSVSPCHEKSLAYKIFLQDFEVAGVPSAPRTDDSGPAWALNFHATNTEAKLGMFNLAVEHKSFASIRDFHIKFEHSVGGKLTTRVGLEQVIASLAVKPTTSTEHGTFKYEDFTHGGFTISSGQEITVTDSKYAKDLIGNKVVLEEETIYSIGSPTDFKQSVHTADFPAFDVLPRITIADVKEMLKRGVEYMRTLGKKAPLLAKKFPVLERKIIEFDTVTPEIEKLVLSKRFQEEEDLQKLFVMLSDTVGQGNIQMGVEQGKIFTVHFDLDFDASTLTSIDLQMGEILAKTGTKNGVHFPDLYEDHGDPNHWVEVQGSFKLKVGVFVSEAESPTFCNGKDRFVVFGSSGISFALGLDSPSFNGHGQMGPLGIEVKGAKVLLSGPNKKAQVAVSFKDKTKIMSMTCNDVTPKQSVKANLTVYLPYQFAIANKAIAKLVKSKMGTGKGKVLPMTSLHVHVPDLQKFFYSSTAPLKKYPRVRPSTIYMEKEKEDGIYDYTVWRTNGTTMNGKNIYIKHDEPHWFIEEVPNKDDDKAQNKWVMDNHVIARANYECFKVMYAKRDYFGGIYCKYGNLTFASKPIYKDETTDRIIYWARKQKMWALGDPISFFMKRVSVGISTANTFTQNWAHTSQQLANLMKYQNAFIGDILFHNPAPNSGNEETGVYLVHQPWGKGEVAWCDNRGQHTCDNRFVYKKKFYYGPTKADDENHPWCYTGGGSSYHYVRNTFKGQPWADHVSELHKTKIVGGAVRFQNMWQNDGRLTTKDADWTQWWVPGKANRAKSKVFVAMGNGIADIKASFPSDYYTPMEYLEFVKQIVSDPAVIFIMYPGSLTTSLYRLLDVVNIGVIREVTLAGSGLAIPGIGQGIEKLLHSKKGFVSVFKHTLCDRINALLTLHPQHWLKDAKNPALQIVGAMAPVFHDVLGKTGLRILQPLPQTMRYQNSQCKKKDFRKKNPKKCKKTADPCPGGKIVDGICGIHTVVNKVTTGFELGFKVGSRAWGAGSDIPLNFDLNGKSKSFNLKVQKGGFLDLIIDWELELWFGWDLKDGFYLNSKRRNDFSFEIGIDMANVTMVGNLGPFAMELYPTSPSACLAATKYLATYNAENGDMSSEKGDADDLAKDKKDKAAADKKAADDKAKTGATDDKTDDKTAATDTDQSAATDTDTTATDTDTTDYDAEATGKGFNKVGNTTGTLESGDQATADNYAVKHKKNGLQMMGKLGIRLAFQDNSLDGKLYASAHKTFAGSMFTTDTREMTLTFGYTVGSNIVSNHFPGASASICASWNVVTPTQFVFLITNVQFLFGTFLTGKVKGTVNKIHKALHPLQKTINTMTSDIKPLTYMFSKQFNSGNPICLLNMPMLVGEILSSLGLIGKKGVSKHIEVVIKLFKGLIDLLEFVTDFDTEAKLCLKTPKLCGIPLSACHDLSHPSTHYCDSTTVYSPNYTPSPTLKGKKTESPTAATVSPTSAPTTAPSKAGATGAPTKKEGKLKRLGAFISKLANGFDPFSFPIIETPIKLLELLSLINGELPNLDLVLFQPAEMEIDFPYKFSIPVPGTGGRVTVGLEGHLSVWFNLALGFDTFGIAHAILPKTPADMFIPDVLDGFYIANKGNGPSRCGYTNTLAARNCYIDCKSNHDCPIGLSCYHGLPVANCLNPSNASLPAPVTNIGIEFEVDLFAELDVFVLEVKIFGGVGVEAQVAFNDPNADGMLRGTELVEIARYDKEHKGEFPLVPFFNLHVNASFNFGYYFWIPVYSHRKKYHITIYDHTFGLNMTKFMDWKNNNHISQWAKSKAKSNLLETSSSKIPGSAVDSWHQPFVLVFTGGGPYGKTQMRHIKDRMPSYPSPKGRMPKFRLDLKVSDHVDADSWGLESLGPASDHNFTRIDTPLTAGQDYVELSDFSAPYFLDGLGGTGFWGDVLVIELSSYMVPIQLKLSHEKGWNVIRGLESIVRFKNFETLQLNMGLASDYVQIFDSAKNTIINGGRGTNTYDINFGFRKIVDLPKMWINDKSAQLNVKMMHPMIKFPDPASVKYIDEVMKQSAEGTYTEDVVMPITNLVTVSSARLRLSDTCEIFFTPHSATDVNLRMDSGTNYINIDGSPGGGTLNIHDSLGSECTVNISPKAMKAPQLQVVVWGSALTTVLFPAQSFKGSWKGNTLESHQGWKTSIYNVENIRKPWDASPRIRKAFKHREQKKRAQKVNTALLKTKSGKRHGIGSKHNNHKHNNKSTNSKTKPERKHQRSKHHNHKHKFE